MITTLLFDLDDTLLANDMRTFVPAYVQAFVEHLAPHTDGPRCAAEIVNGARRMVMNRDPARTLQEVFVQAFYPAMGWDPATWAPRIDEFYRQTYPQLERLTARRPAAAPLLEWAFAAGYEIVIATAPLFPLAAMRERLRWAGLEHFPYRLVTAFEGSHFAKPHPEYFAEILALLGRQPHEALVIGNDWENDIAPAAALGLAHFWIAPSDGTSAPGDAPDPRLMAGRGSLEAFHAWARASLTDFQPLAASPVVYPRLLAGNLSAAVGALAGLSEADWRRRPASGEWSATEIACHLRDVEREVHFPRVRTVVEDDNPFISGADTDAWAAERDYRSQSGPQALADFIDARKRTYLYLAAQPDRAWQRPARHAIFGPTHLAEIVGWSLDHDRLHLAQLASTRQVVGWGE